MRFITQFQIARVNQLRFHGDLTAICRRCFELARILMRFIGDLIHLLQLAIQIAVKSQVVYTCAINRRDNRIKNRMCKRAFIPFFI